MPRLSQDEKNLEQSKERKYCENVDEVDSYWKGLSETEAKDNMKTKTILLAKGKRVEKDVGLRPSDDVMIEDLSDSLYQRFLLLKKLSAKKTKLF